MNSCWSTGRTVAAILLIVLGAAGCGKDSPGANIASAKSNIAKRDFRTATIQLKNVLEKSPDNAEARFLLGKVLLEIGDVRSAEIELRKAMADKHSQDDVAPLLFRSYVALGKFKQVIDEAPTVLVVSPAGKADVKVSLAIALIEFGGRGSRKAGDAALEAALAAQPNYPPARIAQAKLKALDRDVAGAVKILDEVTTAVPSDLEAWLLKGGIHYGSKKLADAVSAFRSAVKAQGDSIQARAGLVHSLLKTAGNDPRSAAFVEAVTELEALRKIGGNALSTKVLEAEVAYAKGDFKIAREALQSVLRVLPDSASALQTAGAIEFRLGSLNQAETYLKQALQAEPASIFARRSLALTYMAMGLPAKARDTIAPALARVGNDVDMLRLAGDLFMQTGDYKNAEDMFARASQLTPEDAGAKTSLAVARLSKGDREIAIRELETISAADVGTTADMALIANHMVRRDHRAAFAAIDVVDKKQPNNPLVLNLRGMIQLEMGANADARKSFEAALALNPVYFPAAEKLSDLDRAEGNVAAAIKRYEAVIAVDPGHMRALLELADLKVKAGAGSEVVTALLTRAVSANPNEVMPRIALIKYHLIANEKKKAVSAAQEALGVFPDNSELMEVLGRAQMTDGDYNQALSTFGKILAKQPAAIWIHMRIAEVHEARKDPEAAIGALKKALKDTRDYVPAQVGLIRLYVKSGKEAEAIAIAREMQAQRPKAPIGYLSEGEIASAKKSWDDAINVYQRGFKQTGAVNLGIRLFVTLVTAGRQAEADKVLADWLKENPKDQAFRQAAAEMAIVRGQYAVAATHLRAVLELAPENAGVLNNLAMLTSALKQPGAIDLAEKANRIAPNQPTIMDTLGTLLADQGEYERAISLVGKAAKAAPDNSAIRLNFVLVLVKAGKKEDAKKELDALAKLGDKFSGQAQVAKMLREL